MAKKPVLPTSGVTSDGSVVSLREEELGFLTQLAGWGKFDEAAADVIRPAGLALPADYCTPTSNSETTVWRIAPDRVLVRSQARPTFDSSDELVVLDLSDARVRVVVEGEGAAGLLSRVIALDFSEEKFPVRSFVQTSLHHVGVLVERNAPGQFSLMIPTTWASSLTGLLADHLAKAG